MARFQVGQTVYCESNEDEAFYVEGVIIDFIGNGNWYNVRTEAGHDELWHEDAILSNEERD